MVATLDYGYLSTPTGQLNIAEIVCLIGGLISVAFTSRAFCELVDNARYIYPDLSTLLVRSVYQSFAILCLTITIVILIVHIYGIRFSGRNFYNLNQICLGVNVITGLMMISIGICAAFWEDKLRQTPSVIRRGYYLDSYQRIFDELTHPRPGAAAAAAVFALLAGILFIIEACTRPMLNTDAIPVPTHSYAAPITTRHTPIDNIKGERIIPIDSIKGERIIPIEKTISSYPHTRV